MKSSSESPSPFIGDSHVQFAWDSVSMGLLKECPRKYYYSIIRGFQPKHSNVHLRFGIILHSALEAYDKAKAEGCSHDDATDAAVQRALVDSWNYPEGFDPWDTETWLAFDPDLRDSEEFGQPWDTENDKKTRDTLIRSVVWYLEHYSDDPAKTLILSSGKPAVELSFKLNTDYLGPSGVEFLYCGHMDRVVEYADNQYVMDRKTTGGSLGAYYYQQYNPDNQMSGYIAASKIIYNQPIAGVIIDAMQILVGSTAFGRGITTRSQAQVDEWFHDLQGWFNLAVMYAEKDYWPMNDKSCHKYAGCQFRQVCSAPPSVRENLLKTDFQVQFWNPLEARNSE